MSSAHYKISRNHMVIRYCWSWAEFTIKKVQAFLIIGELTIKRCQGTTASSEIGLSIHWPIFLGSRKTLPWFRKCPHSEGFAQFRSGWTHKNLWFRKTFPFQESIYVQKLLFYLEIWYTGSFSAILGPFGHRKGFRFRKLWMIIARLPRGPPALKIP